MRCRPPVGWFPPAPQPRRAGDTGQLPGCLSVCLHAPSGQGSRPSHSCPGESGNEKEGLSGESSDSGCRWKHIGSRPWVLIRMTPELWGAEPRSPPPPPGGGDTGQTDRASCPEI